mmetsp:Transcript_72102/g.168750  ORF Transcript_72102/g.168750 Transcript_72102/m.168750 type:complete len:143 (-) Transcript_72102:127-555(-)
MLQSAKLAAALCTCFSLAMRTQEQSSFRLSFVPELSTDYTEELRQLVDLVQLSCFEAEKKKDSTIRRPLTSTGSCVREEISNLEKGYRWEVLYATAKEQKFHSAIMQHFLSAPRRMMFRLHDDFDGRGESFKDEYVFVAGFT